STADLNDIVQGLDCPARPRASVAVLAQSIVALNSSIRSRNEQVERFRASQAELGEKVAVMFGLPRQNLIDEVYAETMRAIYRQTDDCIFFSRLVCIDLEDHGERLRTILRRRFHRDGPRINRVLWRDVEKKGLLPDEEEYQSWITGF